MKKFSERLRHLRKTVLDLTLKDFATRVGTSQGYVHELETEKKDKPSADLLQRIADTFGVRREWLEKGEGEPRPGVAEEAAAYRFDYKTEEGCRSAFDWLLSVMPLCDLWSRLDEILNDESQPPLPRIEMAKALTAAIKRRQVKQEEHADHPSPMPVHRHSDVVETDRR